MISGKIFISLAAILVSNALANTVKLDTENGSKLDCTALKLFFHNGNVNASYPPCLWTLNSVAQEELSDYVIEVKKGGYYVCQTNGTIKTPSIEFEVIYAGKVEIENDHTSVTFNNGEEAKDIKCVVTGAHPDKSYIQWKFRAETADESAPFTNIVDNQVYSVYRNENSSTLTFKLLEYALRGNYMCTANNPAGDSNDVILVRVKDRLAALWPFLGIVCEVLILIAVIFFYEKKSKKAMENNNSEVRDEAIPLKGEDAEEAGLRNRNNK